MKKITINWISEEITVLKITTRRRRSDGTTEMQSIYFKESQVDQELKKIIREGHFWWIWWYFWWNIISFWRFWSSDFLMICSPEFLMKWFIRNSDENPTCLKISSILPQWPKQLDIIGYHDYKGNLNVGFNEYIKLLLFAGLIAWINYCLFMYPAFYK